MGDPQQGLRSAAAATQGLILVATDIASDATLIRKLLSPEFSNIAVSTSVESAAKDFDRTRPQVLLLAFNTLEKAERYYLSLYRFCQVVHSVPHRTLILCGKEDVRSVYDLCRKEFFDDYILFWPISYDGSRLLMSVHLALRALRIQDLAPRLSDVATQARRMAGLGPLLDTSLKTGSEYLANAGSNLERAQSKIQGAFDTFSQQLLGGMLSSGISAVDLETLQREMNRLMTEELGPPLQAALDSALPARQWAVDLGANVRPILDAARRLHTLTEQVRPVVLLVDDDDFQLTTVSAMLVGQNCEIVTVQTGTAALNEVRKRRPDLIFLDVELPEMNGIEVLRRLQASPATASIPVVMVTGNSERAVVVDSLAAGARGFIVKPFDRKLLIKWLNEVLQPTTGE